MATTYGIYSQNIEDNLKLTVSWRRASQNPELKTTVIAWEVYLEPTGFYGTVDIDYTIEIGGKRFTGTAKNKGLNTDDPIVILTGTSTLQHDSNGLYNLYYRATISWTLLLFTHGGGFSGNDNIYMPVIASITSADNVTDEENPTFTYNNPSGDLVDGLEAILYTYNGGQVRTDTTITKDGSSFTFALTADERKKLRKSVTKGESQVFHYYLVTIINGARYIKAATRTLTLVDPEPTLDPTIPIDTNSTTVALTGDDSILVRSYSNVFVETGAEAQKEATIASQYIINGETTVHEGSATFNSVESNTFYYSVTDSRGFTTKDAIVVDFVPYFKPTISLSVLPFSLNGELTFSLKGKYFSGSFGARVNSFSVSYVIVESGQSLETATYQNVPRSASTITGDDYSTNYTISGLDPNKSYQLMVRIKDALDASYASRQSIAAAPLFDWSRTDFNFNVPVYLKDTNIPLEGLEDYVTLQGESGDWFYRLWYSGKVELFGTQDISYLACDTALGGWYRTAVQSSPTYPFTVNNAIVTANYESHGYGAIVWPTTQSSVSKPFDYYLIRPTSSSSITGKMTFHVIGELGGVIA
jgi:hypothetical protein